MGADVTLNDIDSAHIVPRRNSSSNGPKTKNLQILTTNPLRKCHVISPRNWSNKRQDHKSLSSDPSEIPDILNKHFASIGNKFAPKIPNSVEFSRYLH